MASSIRGLCFIEPSKITDDIVGRRNLCNLVVADVSAKIVVSSDVTAMLLKDEINTLNSEADKTWVAGKFMNPYGGDWSSLTPKIDKMKTDTLTNLNTIFYTNPTTMDPLQGISHYEMNIYNNIKKGVDMRGQHIPFFTKPYGDVTTYAYQKYIEDPAGFEMSAAWFYDTMKNPPPANIASGCETDVNRHGTVSIAINCVIITLNNTKGTPPYVFGIALPHDGKSHHSGTLYYHNKK